MTTEPSLVRKGKRSTSGWKEVLGRVGDEEDSSEVCNYRRRPGIALRLGEMA